MKTLTCFFALLLAACVSTSEIVPAGKDSYMVESSARGGLAMGAEHARALKAANGYCTGIGKVMQIRNTETGNSLNYASMSLIFSCLDASDPEYQRPNLRREPTTIVEDQRR